MKNRHFHEDSENFNQTTEATLAVLAKQIGEFVHARTLDSRCAVKLMKRLKREAELVVENDRSTSEGRAELERAFGAVDQALRENDASLLVAANAALRHEDRRSDAADNAAARQ